MMPTPTRLELGKQVRSRDDAVVGELADVVIDPLRKRVTHLVVKPHRGHGQGPGRLVSVGLAKPTADRRAIVLRCSAEEVGRLPDVEDFAYLQVGQAPVSDPDWDVGVTNVLAMPYFDTGGVID